MTPARRFGLVSATISGASADRLFAGSGRTLKDLQTGLDTENPHAENSLVLTNTRVRLTSPSSTSRRRTQCLGWLPPGRNDGRGQRQRAKDRVSRREVVLVGRTTIIWATGKRWHGAKDEEGQIHNGADDNASGSSAVLELAAALAQLRKDKPIAFRAA